MVPGTGEGVLARLKPSDVIHRDAANGDSIFRADLSMPRRDPGINHEPEGEQITYIDPA
jgi:hypothetical protein